MNHLHKIILSTVFLISSLSIGHAQNKLVRGDGVPETLGKDKEAYILFVLKGRNSFDKYLKKNVEKFYHGKYVFVLRKDVESSKYADKKKYRYVFDSVPYYFQDGEEINVNGNDRFFISDRVLEKSYWNGVSSDMFAALIKKCAKDLEKKRLEEE